MSYYKTAKIISIKDENYRVRTITLDAAVHAQPGQFVMVWLPGVDEKPFCVAQDQPLRLTIAKVGPFTEKLFALKQGDCLSFRGPLGSGFTLPKDAKEILLIGGGYGVAPIAFLAQEATTKGITATTIVAARKKEDLILIESLKKAKAHMLASTDDGSEGFHGRAHELAEKLFAQGKKFDCVYACGPEKMMKAIAVLCKQQKTPCELSIERYMGCGIGVCGKCDAGGGLVCKQGPVFSGERALSLEEFGAYHRDTTGRKNKQ